jgi:hypothetical protein
MALSIDYLTNIISVPKADTQFVETNPQTGLEIRQFNVATFAQNISDYQDEAEGVFAATAYTYRQPANVGGVFLAPVVLILNPYTVTFEDGAYGVNFVGANTNLQDFTNVNQVSIRPSNSAGLTFSKQSEDTAFGDNRVWIDTANGLPGTGFPRGTTGDPVDNLADAQSIIAIRRLPKRLHLFGTLNTTGSENLTDYDILGASSSLSIIDVTIGTNTTNLIIEKCSVTGDLNGNITATNATSFNNIIDFDGRMILCGLRGNIDLGTAGVAHEFIDCFSEQEGTVKPILDCDHLVNNKVLLRRYSGGLEIRNFVNSGSEMSIDMKGSLLIDSSCVGGTIVVRGEGVLVDNSGINCTVINGGFNPSSNKTEEIHKLLGLDSTTPVTITPTQQSVDGIIIDVSGDGQTTSTLTRQ